MGDRRAEKARGERMKNWEKYEEELRSVGTTSFGIARYDKKVLNCDDMYCSGCIFDKDNLWGDSRLCGYDKMTWLFKEYEPPKPKLTAQEKAFLDCFETNYACIARDMNGRLYCYSCTPIKDDAGWNQNGSECFELQRHLFKFILWDDEEPWSIEELMELDVEE